MGKKMKRSLSFCLSLALAAAAMPYAGMKNAVDTMPDAQKKGGGAVSNAADTADSELFAALTVSRNGNGLSADGRKVGSSYGGFELSDAGQLTITVEGRQLTLAEAEKEIGCTAMTNKNGELMIVSPFQTGRLIVRSKAAFDTCGALSCEEKFEGLYLLRYDSPAAAYKAYQTISEDPAIEYVDPDGVCTAMGVFDDRALDINSWGRNAIGAPEFCQRLKDEKGELPEVVVAILDTGVYAEHQALQGRVLDNGMCFVDGYGTDTNDVDGHGSHCAGIVCQSTNDNVKILPVKVLNDNGGGGDMGIYCGIMYAIEQGADVLSLSLGGYGKSHLFDEAVAYAKKMGVTVCVASGNETMDSYNCDGTLSSIEDAVVVSAVREDLTFCDFSNYGLSTDFAAPGEDIESVGMKGDRDTAMAGGTSMSTPFVAACFADVLSYDKSLSVDDRYELLKANALDICEPGFDVEAGWGLINLSDFRFDTERISRPEIGVLGGTFIDSFETGLFCETPDAEIYYTLDGSKPDKENGIKYDGEPISIDTTTRIRAVSVKGDLVSAESTEYYVIDGEDANAFLIDDGVLVEYSGEMEIINIPQLVKDKTIPAVKALKDGAFKDNAYITEVILPNSVKTIPSYTFKGCSSLVSVKTAAVEAGAFAFADCISLEKIEGANFKKAGSSAFSGDGLLSGVNCTEMTEIMDFAFYDCVQITDDSFDFENVTRFSRYGLCNTGISGRIDASNAVKLDESAFEGSAVSEVILPESLTRLPDCILRGCSELTYLSAPSVTEIGFRSLELCKGYYGEESAVKTDIDFSAVTEIGNAALSGYVFDGAVSFDSLDEETPVNVIAGAYGESVSLPTLIDVRSVREDEMYFDDDYSADFYVKELRLENAEYISYDAFDTFNFLVLGSDFWQNEFFLTAYRGMILTEEENEFIRESLYDSAVEYSTMPAIYAPPADEIAYRGESYYLNAYSYNPGGSGKWFFLDEEGNESLYAEEGEGIMADTSQAGEYYYIYKIYDENGEETGSKYFYVNVLEPVVTPITADSYVELDGDMMFSNGFGEFFAYGSMTPARSGEYRLVYGNMGVDVSLDGETVLSAAFYGCNEEKIELEAGKSYTFRFRMSPYFYEQENSAGMCIPCDDRWFSVRSEDNDGIAIASLSDFYVSWDDFDGAFPFDPEIVINDGDHTLVRDVDFALVYDEPAHFGRVGYKIVGMGKYYGTFVRDIAEFRIKAQLDETYYASEEVQVDFAPETDGYYKICTIPTEDALMSFMENGAPGNSVDFMPLISVKTFKETFTPFGIESDFVDITPFYGAPPRTAFSPMIWAP